MKLLIHATTRWLLKVWCQKIEVLQKKREKEYILYYSFKWPLRTSKPNSLGKQHIKKGWL